MIIIIISLPGYTRGNCRRRVCVCAVVIGPHQIAATGTGPRPGMRFDADGHLVYDNIILRFGSLSLTSSRVSAAEPAAANSESGVERWCAREISHGAGRRTTDSPTSVRAGNGWRARWDSAAEGRKRDATHPRPKVPPPPPSIRTQWLIPRAAVFLRSPPPRPYNMCVCVSLLPLNFSNLPYTTLSHYICISCTRLVYTSNTRELPSTRYII